MGYARQIQPNGSSREGLYEAMPKHMNIVRMYDIRLDLIAKEIDFDKYITIDEKTAQMLKDRKENAKLEKQQYKERRAQILEE